MRRSEWLRSPRRHQRRGAGDTWSSRASPGSGCGGRRSQPCCWCWARGTCWRIFRCSSPSSPWWALAGIEGVGVGVILNLTVWFALHVLFGNVEEVRAGPLRWYAFDPLALDLKTAALAALAAVLAFRLHRGLVELVVVMALLGIAIRFALPG